MEVGVGGRRRRRGGWTCCRKSVHDVGMCTCAVFALYPSVGIPHFSSITFHYVCLHRGTCVTVYVTEYNTYLMKCMIASNKQYIWYSARLFQSVSIVFAHAQFSCFHALCSMQCNVLIKRILMWQLAQWFDI